MVRPAAIKKEEPVKIRKVKTLSEPEIQFTSSLSMEFEEQESELFEMVTTGSTMEIIEFVPKPEVISPSAVDVYNDPFFNAYFKR